MIWICTLCLLFVAAWLFFNAVNERRWVEAHSHDETVASDEGFLPSFTARTNSGSLNADGKLPINQENSGFSRAVMKVQATTSKYGDKFFESKAAAARIDDPDRQPRSASEEDTFFGRAVARVGEKAKQMDQKLDDKMKQASSMARSAGSAENAGEDIVSRTSRKVAQRSGEVIDQVKNQALNLSQGVADSRMAAGSSSMLGKMAEKVSGTKERLESGAHSISKSTSKKSVLKDQDILSRMTAKVGAKVNSLDDKFVSASKKLSDKLDKS